MKSKTSCFNGALFRRTIRKGLPFWVIYLIGLIVVIPMMILFRAQYADVWSLKEFVLQAAAAGPIVGFLYGPVVAMVVFSHLYKSRSANFYGALPVTRDGQFVTLFAAGFLMDLVPNVLAMVLTVLAGFVAGVNLWVEALVFVGAHALSFFFYFSFAALVAMVVGNLLALPVLYLILNFLAVVVESLVKVLMEELSFGYFGGPDLKLGFLSPLFYTMTEWANPIDTTFEEAETVAITFVGWRLLLILAAVGVGFAVLAFFFHKFRRMESAGDVIAVRHLKPLVLYCFTFGCGLVLGVFFSSMLPRTTYLSVLLCVIIGTVIGFFLGQMLLNRSMRVFRKQYLINCGICCAVALAGTLCIHLDAFGVASYVPQQEDIAAVRIAEYGNSQEEICDDPRFIQGVLDLHRNILSQEEQLREADFWETGYTYVFLSYGLKNGSRVQRQYQIPEVEPNLQKGSGILWQFSELYNDPDYRLLRAFGPRYDREKVESVYLHDDFGHEVRLTRQESVAFLRDILEPDLRESSMQYADILERAAAAMTETVEASTEEIAVEEHPNDYVGINVEVCFEREMLTFGKEDFWQTRAMDYYGGITRDAWRVLEFALEHGLESREYRK